LFIEIKTNGWHLFAKGHCQRQAHIAQAYNRYRIRHITPAVLVTFTLKAGEYNVTPDRQQAAATSNNIKCRPLQSGTQDYFFMTMTISVGIFTYLFASVAYGLLTLLLFVSRRGQPLAVYIITASALTALWAAVLATDAWSGSVNDDILHLVEILRMAAWSLFLLKVMAQSALEDSDTPRANQLIRYYLVLLAVSFTAVHLGPRLELSSGITERLVADGINIIWISLALIGLLLIEHIYRNTNSDSRNSVIFLCLGLGSIFAYDFFMYAEALLYRAIDTQLWYARGVIDGLVVPLIAIAVARNPNWNLRIHVSRHIVFQSATLMGAGLYLLAMAIAGYFVRFLGGSWGGIIQIAFLFGSGLLLVVLLFSGRIRAQLRVLLSKHFFSYKYDYREEWSNFTRTLADSGKNVPEQVILALANLVHSEGGVLWVREEGKFKHIGQWGMSEFEPSSSQGLQKLADFSESRQWVIDITEYRRDPSSYPDLELPIDIMVVPKAWLLIPLLFNSEVLGLVLIEKSSLIMSINWEDRDLLKVAGQQAASHLAQYQANQALVQARQFEAFNRLSAYVVHDLKNILAQQSLIVSNAEKHKDNPAFVDDVIGTVRNSVERMTRLMEQMRSGMRGSRPKPVNLNNMLAEVVARSQALAPTPVCELSEELVTVEADREQLATVFAHIIQNAQEATDRNGEISVVSSSHANADGHQALIEIRDTGTGMDEEFVRRRLFKPFDSTKGLTGMGVGAFESRELVRSLGGDITVNSQPGIGSVFSIVLPCTPIDQEMNT
jgi:putative PEP-CTERM system histidine kinase